MILTVTANPTIDRVYFVEEFKMGKVHRVQKMACSAGGKGINVARVAAVIGKETAAMGFVGGYSGQFIQAEVEKQGITNLFTEIEGETRTCVNISDQSGRSSEILERGPAISKEEKNRFIEEYSANVSDYDVVCISGSLPQGIDHSFYNKLVCLAKEKGKKVIVDTSGDALKEIFETKPYMVKPNREEMSALLGKEITTDDHIKEALLFLKKKGVELPFISLGKEGAAAMTDGHFYKFLPPETEVVNTVGSGDSVVAGIAAGLDMGYDIKDAIKLGMAAGVANTQFKQTGFVTKEVVEKFLSQIRINTFY